MNPTMRDVTANLLRLSLPIEGMTCAACAGRVERALRKVPGVEEVQVNPATDRAEVLGSAGVTALKQAVEGAGYGVAEARFDLMIGGMTCALLVFNQAQYPLIFLIQPITLLHAFRLVKGRMEVDADVRQTARTPGTEDQGDAFAVILMHMGIKRRNWTAPTADWTWPTRAGKPAR